MRLFIKFSRMRSILIFISVGIFPSIVFAGDIRTHKDSELFAWPIYHNPFDQCSGTCAVSIYGGRFLETSLLNVSRANTFSSSSNWKDSGLVAATFSRKLIENPDWWSIEAEFGGAKRFGELASAENWIALYLRWSAFPWSKTIRTSIALSTGLNYAWSKDRVEDEEALNGGRGSQLMHYFSPEITLGLPDHPEWDLFFRLHHRSGMAIISPAISVALFNQTWGGAQYFTFGLRYRF